MREYNALRSVFSLSFAVLVIIIKRAQSGRSAAVVLPLKNQQTKAGNKSGTKSENKLVHNLTAGMVHHREASYNWRKGTKSKFAQLVGSQRNLNPAGDMDLETLETWIWRRRAILKSLPGLRMDVMAQIDSSSSLNLISTDAERGSDCFVCKGPASDGVVNDNLQWLLVLCRSCARDCSISCALATPLPLHRRCRSCAKWAVYGSVNVTETGTKRASACAEHRRSDEVDVVHKLCQAGCGTVATSGDREQGRGRPLYCKRHRPPGSRTVTNRQCQHPEGCLTWPAFGPAPASPGPGVRAASLARFCRRHRSPDHVDLVNRRCAARGCPKQPRFGVAGARYCKTHWKEPDEDPRPSGRRPARHGDLATRAEAAAAADDGTLCAHSRRAVRVCRPVPPLALGSGACRGGEGALRSAVGDGGGTALPSCPWSEPS
jgi:hypothetical protein